MPLPIEAMIHAAKADDAVARALLARHNPVLEARLAERHDEGVREGVAHATQILAEAVLAVLAARGIAVGDAERALIVNEHGVGRLKRWLVAAATWADTAELLVTSERD